MYVETSSQISPRDARRPRLTPLNSSLLADAPPRLLAAASERLRGRGGAGTSPCDDSASPLGLLCLEIERAARGETPDASSIPPFATARSLIDQLRREVIDCASQLPAVDPEELIAVLRAIEQVQEALHQSAAHRFAAHVSGPDAVEAIVAVAHDLRSPLASILFLADALRNGASGPLNAHQIRQIRLVYAAAFGLSSAASDLIDLTRGGDRLLEATAIPFSVRGCLESVRDIVQPIAEEKQLSFELELPKLEARIGHPAALTRVLLNLATNSLKFTENGGVKVSAVDVARTWVEFSVSDSGRGIPAEVLESLFDTFRRTQKGERYLFSRAGLGLSICQTLVSRMGGTLTVTSSPDTGTCFRFQLELPAARGA